MGKSIRRWRAAVLTLVVSVSHAACGGSPNENDLPESTPVATESSQPAQRTPQSAVPSGSKTPSSSPSSTGAIPSFPHWAFPVFVDGWDVTAVGEDGYSQLTSPVSSCVFSAIQAPAVPEYPGDDRKSTESDLKRLVATYELLTDITVTSINGPGDPVDFLMVDATYTRTFLTKMRFAIRQITDVDAVLMLSYQCAAEDFSDADWDDLVSRVQAWNVSPLKF